MIQAIINKVGEACTKIVVKCGVVIAKESVKQSARFAGKVAAQIMVVTITTIMVSNYKDKAFNEFLKKHDKDEATKLSEQFQVEIDRLKQEIANLKLDKEQSESRFRKGVESICKKYGIEPNEVLKG